MILVIIIVNYRLIGYGIGQAQGQIHIMWNAEPIDQVLARSDFPDSLKEMLYLVDGIKKFSIDSLGLQPSENYTKVFDQKGEEVLWVVSACDPYKFEPRTWSFPIIGTFTYKGYFDKDKAIKLARELFEEGLDVHMRSVSGWSTLGWFKDPILSNMLSSGPGDLANTLIHELTHSTIFIPDSMTFNENLATFIGNEGAKEYLEFKYGADSKYYLDYIHEREDSKLFTAYMVLSATRIDSLYATIDEFPDSLKLVAKNKLLGSIVTGLDTIPFYNEERYEGLYQRYKPNNAFFISFLNYRERQAEFEIMLRDSMNSNIQDFINYWQSQYSR